MLLRGLPESMQARSRANPLFYYYERVKHSADGGIDTMDQT
jgi:hypothetical protein